ncbi:hypothetical protein EDB86DRAFT_3250527 [Lactarius hatsudake]|nr:hypothetical protein EDB86DRAFT_3250527 [Lactarius hatsudake]
MRTPIICLSPAFRGRFLNYEQSLLALFLGIIGACVKAPALKEITWASEMNTRICQDDRKHGHADVFHGFRDNGESTVGDLASNLGKSLLYLLEMLVEPERKGRVAESAQACADRASPLSTRGRVCPPRQLCPKRDAALRRVKQVHERNRTQGNIPTNRFIHSYSQIGKCIRFRKSHCNNVCRTTGTDAKQEFEHVSRLVKTELEWFEQERIVDFKENLEQLLDGAMTRQKELIQAREALQ